MWQHCYRIREFTTWANEIPCVLAKFPVFSLTGIFLGHFPFSLCSGYLVVMNYSSRGAFRNSDVFAPPHLEFEESQKTLAEGGGGGEVPWIHLYSQNIKFSFVNQYSIIIM